MITIKGDYELDDDRTRVDTDVVWDFMATEAYWARWRERSDVEAQLAAAWRIVGVYENLPGAWSVMRGRSPMGSVLRISLTFSCSVRLVGMGSGRRSCTR